MSGIHNFYFFKFFILFSKGNFTLMMGRVVTKILSCRVNTTSRRGIKWLGLCFGSIFLHFPIKVAGGHSLSSRGKYPAPGS